MRQIVINYSYIWSCALALYVIQKGGGLDRVVGAVSPPVALGLMVTTALYAVFLLIDRR